MSTVGPEASQQDLAAEIRRDFASIMGLNLEIGRIATNRDEVLSSILAKIQEGGIPEEEKFTVLALMNRRLIHRDPEFINQKIDALRALDGQLKSHGGQLIAWLDSKDKVVSYRDPGPNLMESRRTFNVGMLPDTARIEVGLHDSYIPVNKAVSMPFGGIREGRDVLGNHSGR